MVTYSRAIAGVRMVEKITNSCLKEQIGRGLVVRAFRVVPIVSSELLWLFSFFLLDNIRNQDSIDKKRNTAIIKGIKLLDRNLFEDLG